MVYLLMFLISITMITIGLKNKSIFGKILIFIGLILPCIMAGLRDVSVGTDTSGIYYRYFSFAKSQKNFVDFLNFIKNYYVKSDSFFEFVVYIVAHLNLSYNFLLFIIEVLIIFPIYFALKNISKNNNEIILGLLYFYLLLYNLSLNMLRQSVAIAFVLLAFSIFITKKDKKGKILTILCLLIAIGNHSTAFLGILMILLYSFYNNSKISIKSKRIISVILVILSLFILMFYKKIFIIFANLNITKTPLFYLEKYSQLDFDYTGTLINIGIILFLIFNKNKFNEKLNMQFGITISLINLILSQMGVFILYFHRVSYYLFYILILYVSQLKIKGKKEKIYVFLITLLFVCDWTIVILVKNSNETLPYLLMKFK